MYRPRSRTNGLELRSASFSAQKRGGEGLEPGTPQESQMPPRETTGTQPQMQMDYRFRTLSSCALVWTNGKIPILMSHIQGSPS